MAPYEKSLKGLQSLLSSSTRAGFCWFPRSKRLGPLKERPPSLKLPADGQRSLRSRRSAYRPKKDGLRFISAFTLCGTFAILKSWDSLGIFLSISKKVLSFFGTPAWSTGRGRSKGSLKLIRVFTRTPSLDMARNLTLMSSFGDTLNVRPLMAFQKISMILETPLIALPKHLKNSRFYCGSVSEPRSCHGSKVIPITFATLDKWPLLHSYSSVASK